MEYLADWPLHLERTEEYLWFLCKYANQDYERMLSWPSKRVSRGVQMVVKLYKREESAMEEATRKNK